LYLINYWHTCRWQFLFIV